MKTMKICKSPALRRLLGALGIATAAVAAPAHAAGTVGNTLPANFPVIEDASLAKPVIGFGAAGAVSRVPVIFLHGNNDTPFPTACNPIYGHVQRLAQYLADNGYSPSELWGLGYQGDRCDVNGDQTFRSRISHLRAGGGRRLGGFRGSTASASLKRCTRAPCPAWPRWFPRLNAGEVRRRGDGGPNSEAPAWPHGPWPYRLTASPHPHPHQHRHRRHTSDQCHRRQRQQRRRRRCDQRRARRELPLAPRAVERHRCRREQQRCAACCQRLRRLQQAGAQQQSGVEKHSKARARPGQRGALALQPGLAARPAGIRARTAIGSGAAAAISRVHAPLTHIETTSSTPSAAATRPITVAVSGMPPVVGSGRPWRMAISLARQRV